MGFGGGEQGCGGGNRWKLTWQWGAAGNDSGDNGRGWGRIVTKLNNRGLTGWSKSMSTT